MSLEQIGSFFAESMAYEKKWKRIDILGGEPALYSRLSELFALCESYHQWFPKAEFRWTTNGIKEPSIAVPSWFTMRNTAKQTRRQNFDCVNNAPSDNGIKHPLMCSIPWRCGLGLSRGGYYLCGAGAAIDRVFGWDVGVKTLAELTPARVREQRAILCKVCGHSRSVCARVTEQKTSVSWQTATEAYNATQPKGE